MHSVVSKFTCHSERSEESLLPFGPACEPEERLFATLRMTCKLTFSAMYSLFRGVFHLLCASVSLCWKLPRRLLTADSRLTLLPLAFLEIDEPGKADAQNVQADQRNPDDEDGGEIVGGDDGRRHHRRNQDGVAYVLPQESRGHDAEDREQQNDDRQFEDQSYRHDHRN